MNGNGPALNRAFFLGPDGWPYLLVPFIALAIALEIVGASPTLIFFVSAIGIIPTAALMGRATEELAERSGPGIGGLLNVTFGNAPELIIALFALNAGLQEVVKASIIGSILGNVLLVLGAAMVSGGIGRPGRGPEVRPDRRQLAVDDALPRRGGPAHAGDLRARRGQGAARRSAPRSSTTDRPSSSLSLAVSVVLILCYVAGLFFSLKTHRDIFNPQVEARRRRAIPRATSRPRMETTPGAGASAPRSSRWRSPASRSASCRRSSSDRSRRPPSRSGLSEFFIGAIVVAIVGNAAEHWVAVLVAYKGKMDLAVNIAIGSSAQVALFVAPVLVFASFVIGPSPMPLVFNGFELGAILLAALIANAVTQEGESTWFEGVQLLAVYAVFAIAFFVA